jgi:hypothetical protein
MVAQKRKTQAFVLQKFVGDQQGSLIEMITGKQGLSGTVPGFHTLSLLTQRAINSVFADSAQEKSFEKWDREEDKKCFNFNILQTKKRRHPQKLLSKMRPSRGAQKPRFQNNEG